MENRGGECAMCIRGFMEDDGCSALSGVMKGEMTMEEMGMMVPEQCHQCAEGAAKASWICGGLVATKCVVPARNHLKLLVAARQAMQLLRVWLVNAQNVESVPG